MGLTLVQLHTFTRFAELGNFTRTAEELQLTQPAITLQVRALSEHFGVPLVEIIKRRPVLTEAGRFLVERSRAVLEDVEALEREMSEFTSAKTGSLTLGATLTIGNYALPPLLAGFKSTHPQANVNVLIANAARLASHLHARRISVALAVGQIEDPAFDVAPFAEDRLVLVVPPAGHPFSRRRTVGTEELAEQTFVTREALSSTRIVAERELAEHGVHVNAQLVVPSVEAVSRAVEAGIGIAILSWLVVERDVREGRLHVVDIKGVDLRRQFKVVSLKERPLSPLATEFVKFLRRPPVPTYRPHAKAARQAT